MNSRSLFKCCLFLSFLWLNAANAQTDTGKPVKVAVFAPLYLQDAFDGDSYKLGKINLPKNLLPGLEFYNGAMMAADSLNKEGALVTINVYDTKMGLPSLTGLLMSPQMNNTGLIIAAITNTAELKLFADEALKKNIPLISATYPNTSGVSINPNFILLNSTLKTHIEGIYRHLQKNYSLSKILLVNRKGATEEYIKTLFTELNKKSKEVPLKMNWLELTDSFATRQILGRLDSFSNNVVVVASPYENFGLRVVKSISSNKSYRTTAIGMPTWDGIKELNTPDCKNVEIVYSTPFFYGNNNLASFIAKNYRGKFHSRPSDMAYRGFESVYHFTRLLLKYRDNIINNLTDKDYTLFNRFDIQPVNGKDGIEYYENKYLFFLKKQEGSLIGVN